MYKNTLLYNIKIAIKVHVDINAKLKYLLLFLFKQILNAFLIYAFLIYGAETSFLIPFEKFFKPFVFRCLNLQTPSTLPADPYLHSPLRKNLQTGTFLLWGFGCNLFVVMVVVFKRPCLPRDKRASIAASELIFLSVISSRPCRPSETSASIAASVGLLCADAAGMSGIKFRFEETPSVPCLVYKVSLLYF